MKWRKRGLVFCPSHNFDWMVSHASNPVAEPVTGTITRIYFSCRDRNNRSSIGSIVTDLRNPGRILEISAEPLVEPGAAGLFDDSGASVACLVTFSGARYLYYTGWNLAVTVPWRNSIGLAISALGEREFRKYSPAPIIDRSAADPFSVSYPWVLNEEDRWRIWYGSNLRWGAKHSDMDHVIKYAESRDGIHWDRNGVVAIPLGSPGEWGVSRPSVLKENGIYKMWYSTRTSETYRIGYAESPDGVQWERMDSVAGISVSEQGWDSDMIEYACVFDQGGQRYMLYNGNGFGKSGVGLAELAESGYSEAR